MNVLVDIGAIRRGKIFLLIHHKQRGVDKIGAALHGNRIGIQ